MKKDIHPKYGPTKVTCSCGNTFETGSTMSEIKIELCSACHPFFTGKQKIIDTAGRVEKFKRKMGQKQEGLISKKVKREEKKRNTDIEIKFDEEEEKPKKAKSIKGTKGVKKIKKATKK